MYTAVEMQLDSGIVAQSATNQVSDTAALPHCTLCGLVGFTHFEKYGLIPRNAQ